MSQNPYSQPQQPQEQPQPHYQQPPGGQQPQQPYPPGGYYAPPPRSAWPKVVGVISIVLGCLCTCVSLGGMAMKGMQFASPGMAQPQVNLPPWMEVWSIIQTILSLILSALLVTGGILLLKRRPVSRPLHLIYALGDIVISVFGLLVSVPVLRQVFAQTNTGAAPKGAMVAVGIISGVVGATIALAWPVFLLIWFCRRKIVREVRSWGGP